MADESVIKEFLVRLGFKVDSQQHAQFTGAIRNATLQSQLMADALEAVAQKVIQFARSVNEGLEQLYWASYRTKTSVENLQAFSFAMSNLGSSAARAQQMSESLAEFQDTYGEGARTYIASLIGTTNAAKDTTGQLEALGKRWKALMEQGEGPKAIAEAKFLGYSRADMMSLTLGTEQLGEKAKAVFKAFGVQMQDASKGATEFNDRLRYSNLIINTLYTVVASKLNEDLAPAFDKFNKLIIDNKDEIIKFIENMFHWFEKVATAVNEVVQHLGGWETVIKAIVILKFANWLWGVTAAVRGLAGGLATLAGYAWLLRLLPLLLSGSEGPLQDDAQLKLAQRNWDEWETYRKANPNYVPPEGWAAFSLKNPGFSTPASPGQRPVSLSSGEVPIGDPTKLLEVEQSQLGKTGSQVNAWLAEHHQKIDAAQEAWCAAFVNASLEAVGVKGTGSNVATSFLNWSKQRVGPAVAGDIGVQAKGLAPGQTGGHVGTFTGNTRTGPNGQLQYELRGGNQGGKVTNEWFDASSLTMQMGPTQGATQGEPSQNTSDVKFNPGNLNYNPKQPGVIRTNSRFGSFKTMEEGVAASARQLMIDQDRHRLMTLEQLIGDPEHGWAPKKDGNDPEAYVRNVGPNLPGWKPGSSVNVHDSDVLYKLLEAQFKQEGREKVSPEEIRAGIKLQQSRPDDYSSNQFNRPITPDGTGGGRTSNVNLAQNTTINVTGAGDPQATASMVASAQDRTNQNLIRYTRSAVG